MEKLASNGGRPVRTKPFAQWPIYDELEEKLVLEVVRSGNWGGVQPDKIKQLEDQFVALHDAEYAVAVNNGTVAITISLLAAGIDFGDEVIMPPYTFVATPTATMLIGAIPVFVDVDDCMLLDPDLVEAAITPKTKAIIAVHIAGAPAQMTRLRNIADKHHLVLIEDAAQAVGARWEGAGVGSIGDMGTFSLQSSKNLNSGEGGMILSNRKQLADEAWSIHHCGRVRDGAWYQHERIGWNFRMTEIQAALALAQMTRLEEQMQRREQNAKFLTELLGGIEALRVLEHHPGVTRHAYHLYMFRIDSRFDSRLIKSDFIRNVNAEGIPISAGYVPLNQNRAILERTRQLAGEDKVYPCPVAEQAAENEILWLGQDVLLGTEADMADIAKALRKVVQGMTGS